MSENQIQNSDISFQKSIDMSQNKSLNLIDVKSKNNRLSLENHSKIKNTLSFKDGQNMQNLIDFKESKNQSKNFLFPLKNEDNDNFLIKDNLVSEPFKKNTNNKNIKNIKSIKTNTEEEMLIKGSIDLKEEKNNNFLEFNIAENNLFKKFNPEEINDEIYPGENSPIYLYDSGNPNNKKNTSLLQNAKILNDNIYINNLNIIGTNYLGGNTILEKKLQNFQNLEISLESCVEINSIYENINKITNYQYTKDKKLMEETKNFLIDKCQKEKIDYKEIFDLSPKKKKKVKSPLMENKINRKNRLKKLNKK
jgi:hypothetical protein